MENNEQKRESPIWATIRKLEAKVDSLEKQIEILENVLRGK